jgi:predicted adenylyl cyclase CyaB
MIEVELKARVRDRRAVEAAVGGFASLVGETDKRDSYWKAPSAGAGAAKRDFRLRREGGTSVVTFKQKRVEEGIEVNVEREFVVSDPEAFAALAERIGCLQWYEKRKRGLKYEAASGSAADGKATIEIVEVEGLGGFIEIEVLLAREDPAAVARARGELRSLLARAGCSEADIEPRYYSELLAAAAGN